MPLQETVADITRSLHCVFCDDIRQEVGNKASFMGVYQGALIFPSFPATLQKLCIAMTASAPAEDDFKSVTFIVMFNENVVLEIPIPDGSTRDVSLDHPLPELTDLKQSRNVVSMAVLPNLHFDKPTVVRTRLITERETLRGNGLIIAAANELAQVKGNP